MSRDIEVTRAEDVVVACLRGDVDMACIPIISAHVLDALTMDVNGLIVDLTDVQYVDSAGVHMLFDFARRLEAGRQGMAITLGPTSPVRRLLEITNLDQVISVCVQHSDAVAAVSAGARRAY
ncbi:MAG TPA: STAS domain-containing protein [Mycobacteriales bacterium]|nr:STAS domain-containing protein [Mycobacteriales bacterium]